MGSKHGGTEPGTAGSPRARRAFLQKAAAGTAAFALPMIITVDPAGAQALNSPPPEPPGSGRERQASRRTELPRTGNGLDRLVAAGLTATASGAALVLWSAELESRSAAPQPADPEPET
ncbi:MAG TPA: hypothetical protein VKD21_17155 [Acidimicrobiales bacterium]|nr:hypothetical protein [Acidimicrobiales bacterium]